MATNFPTSADSFTNPTAVDTLDSPPHDQQHADINDAMEAVQTALLDGAPLHIDDANERVGIGTTTPSQELDVNGDIVVPAGNGIMFDRVGSDSHILYKETPSSSTYGSPDDVVLRNPNGARLRFQTNGTNDRMTVDSSGKVGINDTSPSYTLDVNGDINATGNVRVAGNPVGMVLIASSTATSGIGLSFDNVFSSTFNAYRIVLVVNCTSAFGVTMRMRSGGSDSTGSNYRYVRTAYTYGGTLSQSASTGDTKWNIPCIASTNNSGGVLDVYNPYSANKTSYSGSGSDGRVGSGTGAMVGGGILNTNASYDGFTLISSAINSLIVSVYGYNNG